MPLRGRLRSSACREAITSCFSARVTGLVYPPTRPRSPLQSAAVAVALAWCWGYQISQRDSRRSLFTTRNQKSTTDNPLRTWLQRRAKPSSPVTIGGINIEIHEPYTWATCPRSEPRQHRKGVTSYSTAYRKDNLSAYPTLSNAEELPMGDPAEEFAEC